MKHNIGWDSYKGLQKLFKKKLIINFNQLINCRIKIIYVDLLGYKTEFGNSNK